MLAYDLTRPPREAFYSRVERCLACEGDELFTPGWLYCTRRGSRVWLRASTCSDQRKTSAQLAVEAAPHHFGDCLTRPDGQRTASRWGSTRGAARWQDCVWTAAVYKGTAMIGMFELKALKHLVLSGLLVGLSLGSAVKGSRVSLYDIARRGAKQRTGRTRQPYLREQRSRPKRGR